MRVLTTIFLAFPEQNDDRESEASIFEDYHRVGELPFELISIFEGKNRVIVIERGED